MLDVDWINYNQHNFENICLFVFIVCFTEVTFLHFNYATYKMYFTKEFRLHSIEDTTFVTYKINNLESNKKRLIWHWFLVVSNWISQTFIFFRLSQSVLCTKWSMNNLGMFSSLFLAFFYMEWSRVKLNYSLWKSVCILDIYWVFQTAVCSSPSASLTLFLLLAVEFMLTVSLFLGFFRLDLSGLLMLAGNTIVLFCDWGALWQHQSERVQSRCEAILAVRS